MKNILLSKTFWLNVAGLALTYGAILPPKYAMPLVTGANVVNRFFTYQPVWLFKQPLQ